MSRRRNVQIYAGHHAAMNEETLQRNRCGQIMERPKNRVTRVYHVTTVHSGLDPRIFWKECVSLGLCWLSGHTAGPRHSHRDRAECRVCHKGGTDGSVSSGS